MLTLQTVRIQWCENTIQDYHAAKRVLETIERNPTAYFTSLINSICANLHSKGLLGEIRAVVPLDPRQADLAVPRQSFERVREAYGALEFEMLGENDPIWDFWKCLVPDSPVQWKLLGLGDFRSRYNRVRNLILQDMIPRQSMTPELQKWFDDSCERLSSLYFSLWRELGA